MYDMSVWSLLRPFTDRTTLKSLLPTLAIQNVVFVLMLLFSRFIPQNLEKWRERMNEAENEQDALRDTMLLLTTLAGYSLMRHFYAVNVKMTATVFSKEISAFYLRQFGGAAGDELLKKHEKSTQELIISVSNVALETSILGLTLYDTNVRGLPYYLAWAYCLARGTLALTCPLKDAPLVLPIQVPEAAVTQARHHAFFSVPRAIKSCHEKEQRALLMMGFVGVSCLLKAPELFGFLTQLSRHVELMCANISEARVITANAYESLNLG